MRVAVVELVSFKKVSYEQVVAFITDLVYGRCLLCVVAGQLLKYF